MVSKRLLEHGVTGYCPTIITSPLSTYEKLLPQLKKSAGGRHGAAVLGAHLEVDIGTPTFAQCTHTHTHTHIHTISLSLSLFLSLSLSLSLSLCLSLTLHNSHTHSSTHYAPGPLHQPGEEGCSRCIADEGLWTRSSRTVCRESCPATRCTIILITDFRSLGPHTLHQRCLSFASRPTRTNAYIPLTHLQCLTSSSFFLSQGDYV